MTSQLLAVFLIIWFGQISFANEGKELPRELSIKELHAQLKKTKSGELLKSYKIKQCIIIGKYGDGFYLQDKPFGMTLHASDQSNEFKIGDTVDLVANKSTIDMRDLCPFLLAEEAEIVKSKYQKCSLKNFTHDISHKNVQLEDYLYKRIRIRNALVNYCIDCNVPFEITYNNESISLYHDLIIGLRKNSVIDLEGLLVIDYHDNMFSVVISSENDIKIRK